MSGKSRKPTDKPQPDEWETGPCGCRAGTGMYKGVMTFFYEPCAPDCPHWLYAQAQAALAGVKLEYRIEGHEN